MKNLLTTKLFFPGVRENLVARPRLISRVKVGLQRSLLLISAPAGYGKTTLMSEWRAGLGADQRVAWLSLDRDDNDASYFLTYLIAALATQYQGFGEITQGLLESTPSLPLRVILANLINELEKIDEPFCLVLDDYHVIADQSIHDTVTYILDHQPSRMHLVILTRADPPLPLPRLRASNHMVEIRAADLRFTPEEAAAFLSEVMGLTLSSEDVSALEQRTEGWVAGLQLAALSLQGRADIQRFISVFTGSHHYIVDYLADEVLNHQPQHVQEFLLRTSIPDRLTAPLCDVLTGRTDSQSIVERLEHANLFLVPLDDEQRWYRYHHLFRDVLRKRLGQIYPVEIPELHHRAAAWFEDNKLFEEALNHCLEINDFEQAAELLSNNWWLLFNKRSLSSVLALLKNFPENMIRTHPRLSLIYAWNLWSMGLRNEAEAYVLNAQHALSQGIGEINDNKSVTTYSALKAETTAFLSLIASRHEDRVTAVEFANQAVRIAPPDDFYTRGLAYVSLYNAYRELGRIEDAIQACMSAVKYARLGKNLVSTVDAIYNHGQLLKIQGHLHRAGEVYQEGLLVAENQGLAQLPPISLLHFGLADVLYEWNHLDETERHLNLGFQLLEQNNVLLISMLGYITLARLKRAKGDKQEAMQVLLMVEQEAKKKEISTHIDKVVASRVTLQAELGNVAAAAEWVKNLEIGKDDPLGYRMVILAIQLARVHIAMGSLDEALDLLTRIEQSAETTRSISWLIETIVLQAIVWKMKNRTDVSLMRVEKALSLAEPEGQVRVFLDEGEMMIVLLQHAAKKGMQPEYVRKLLTAEKSPIRAQLLIEPLSARELEVLRLVAEGLSNGQIANKLIIAQGTVKKHINNIFGKLGVQSRTQSVARAHELKLL